MIEGLTVAASRVLNLDLIYVGSEFVGHLRAAGGEVAYDLISMEETRSVRRSVRGRSACANARQK